MKSKVTIETLGAEIRKKRGDDGIRQAAAQIGISSATLSRIENGKLPDIETFTKICRWLGVDGGSVLGCSQKNVPVSQSSEDAFHLKADKNLRAESANALAEMILAAQKMFSNA